MKQPRKIPGILIYLLILFFSVIGFVYALHSNVKEGYKQVVNLGGSEKTSDGVEVSKTIEETKLENYFDITLTVKTSSKIEEIITAQDIAVVIVMDISNTMNETWSDNGTTKTRLKSAKESAISFLDEFYKSSIESPTAARKIGFVTFNKDSYQVFGLSDCKSTEEFDNLSEKINNITAPDSYNIRWTNMEAGLARANDMLNETNIKNKYIIFITDGLPTTYSTSVGGTTGYYPGTNSENVTSTAEDGIFYNYEQNRTVDGVNYSDKGARRAEEMALKIRNNNTTIYSIGIGMTNRQTIYTLMNSYPYILDTDKLINNYEYYSNSSPYKKGRYYALLPGVPKAWADCTTDEKKSYYNNTQYYKNWLRDYIGSNKYFDSDKGDELASAYEQIFADIKEMTEESAQATWVAEDPMGVDGAVENIEFVGFLDDASSLQNSLKNGETNQSDTATITNNKINWDLKDSTYTTTEEENTTYYFYSIKYRVRIENELDSFRTEKIYKTNGVTKLTYVTRNNGVLSENKEVEFPIPSVVAYLGEFSFTKKSASFDVIESGILAGAEFTLTHHKDCPCMVESDTNHIHMPETQSYKAVSGTDGKVTFTNIPSGHDYLLKETKAPDNYTASKTTKKINIAYGKVTGNPSNTEYENNIKTGDLKIAKTVEGNKDYSGEFEFKIVVKFDKTTLTGTYDYSLFDTSGKETTGKLKLTDTFKLKDGEYIIIKDLPIDSTYEITELTTNGYTVKHTINSESRVTGKTATCSSNSCSIDSEDTQEVNFYNIAGYILPATGDSGMLILIIIASLLIIGPIIDIGYMFYKYRKEDKLTS